MLFQEALRELGLDAPVPPDQVRRAYLKKVKLHSPETDPEGFARVREAFEMVSRVARMRAEALGFSEEAEQKKPSPERQEAKSEEPREERHAAREQQAPSAESSTNDEKPAAEAPGMVRWWLAGEGAKADAGARADDPPAKEDPPSRVVDPPAKEDAAKDDDDDENEASARPRSEDFAETRAELGRLLENNDFKAAAPLLIEDIDRSLAAMRTPFVAPISCVHVALELQARGVFGLARQIIEAIERQAAARGGDIHLFKQHELTRWMFVREINDLKRYVSKVGRRTIARAAVADHPETSASWLNSLHYEDQRALRSGNVKALAPVVTGMCSRAVALPEEQQPIRQDSRGRGIWGGLGGGAFAFFWFLRAVARCGMSHDDVRSTDWKSQPVYVAPNPGMNGGPKPGKASWDNVWSDSALARPSASGSVAASSSVAPPLASASASVEKALASKNCDAAKLALARARLADQADKTGAKPSATDALAARVDGLCKGTK